LPGLPLTEFAGPAQQSLATALVNDDVAIPASRSRHRRRRFGKRAMSATERQRRWRKRRRLGQVGRPSMRPSPVELAPVSVPKQHQAPIEKRERDQARQPRAVGPDNPSRCFVCLRRRPEVKVMLDLSRRRQEVFLFDGCIDRLSRMSNERIARLATE
jgi:hypothetical protein